MLGLPEHISVPSADIVRQFGRWQDHATNQPVLVTHHGRARVMLVSTSHYRELVEGGGRGDAVQAAGSEQIEGLMEHVSEGFIAFRSDMTVVAINRAACLFLKIQRDAIVGRKLDERLPGIDDTLSYANLRRAITSGSISTFEMPSFVFEDRWMKVQTFPFDQGAALMFHDITDEIEARCQVNGKVATIDAITAHGEIGRAKISARGTFVAMNDAFAAVAGFTADGLMRSRLTDILATRHRVVAADAIEAVLEGGSAVALDSTVLTRAGEERDVRIGLAAIRGQNGVTGAWLVMTACQREDNPAAG